MIARSFKDEILRGDEAPAIVVNVPGIPKRLRALPRWVCWRWERNRNRQTKVPIQPSGHRAKSNDPTTWCSFDEALAAHRQHGWGIGFVLTADDGFACLDLDNCRNPHTGELAGWAEDVIAAAGGYAEVSPSGTGVKVFVLATLPDGMRSKYPRQDGVGEVELFSDKRFLCVTGLHVEGTPADVPERQSGLNIVCGNLKGWNPERQKPVERPAATLAPGDDVETALAALQVLDPDMSYSDWMAVGMALHSVDQSAAMCAEWDRWSRQSEKYVDGEPDRKWRSFTSGGGVTVATICRMADATGQRWRPERRLGQPPTTRSAMSGGEAGSACRPADDGLSIARPEGQTELAHSERFLRRHGDRFRYVPQWEARLYYEGGRWEIDTGDVHGLEAVKDITRGLWDDVKSNPTNDSVKYVQRMGKNSSCSATLSLASTSIAIRHTDLDANPWLLNCQNGTLDLRTGELREHRREDLLTKSVRVPFNAVATCPTWDRFISEVFPSARLAQFMQRLAGYCLTGDVSEQVLPIFHGCGANGKSTLLTALQWVLGDYAGQAPSGMLALKKHESHPTEVAGLFGKRFVVTSETEGNCRLAESLVKQLTGGDVITARRMRENFWEFHPTHKLILCTNHKPIVRGTDHGIWRRLLLVPFEQVFDGPRKDPQLPAKLAAEAEGILAWCVRGCLEWQRDGLKPPEEVRAATDAYKSQEDVVGRFVQECCEVGSSAMTCRFTDLYAAFRNWCEEGGERCPSSKAVSQWLTDNSFEKYRNNGSCYRGIELKGF